MKKNFLIVIFSILALATPHSSFSDEGLFGPEWTFTNREIFNGDYSFINKKAKDFTDHILNKCPSCTSARGYKGRDWIQVNEDIRLMADRDPGVIEVNAQPLTLKKIKQYKELLQDLVFDSAQELGMKVHYRLVGGHIHLDKKTHFEGNELLMRNFIVDLFNHSELFLGALSHDYLNAKPISILSKSALDNLEKIIETYDKGDLSWISFLKEIESTVYENSDNVKNSYSGISEIKVSLKFFYKKYHSINLSHEKTLEVRGFQPQQSIDHYILMAELLESRIKFLKTNFKTEKVPYIRKSYKDQWSVLESRGRFGMKHTLHMYKTYVDPELILDVYKDFVEGTGNLYKSHKGKDFKFKTSGLNWSDYKPYIADKRLKSFLKEQDKREQKRRRESQESKGSCNTYL